MPAYEAVIGLEVHVQLATATKLFCSCPTSFGQAPNSNVCEVCGGMPGALPMLNRQAVHYACLVGLATNSTAIPSLPAKTIFIPTCRQATRFRSSTCPSVSTAI